MKPADKLAQIGLHFIVKPFDSRLLSEHNISVDIHKDNPINLYIP